jgi:uncharacterized protein (DUF302 family)
MRILNLCVFLLLIASSPFVSAEKGMISYKSTYSVDETVEKLEKILKEKGMTIFAIVEHSEGAKQVGITLPPTQVVIFGNPKVGSLLMQCARSTAIDLPQKALIYEDSDGTTRLAFNDPKYLNSRHGLSQCQKPIEKISAALANIAETLIR